MAVGKGETVLVLSAALVVVAALAGAIAWQGGWFGVEGREGPQISALGQTWDTRIIDGEGDHNTYAIWTRLAAVEGTDPSALDMGPEMWIALCDAVLAEAEGFMPAGVLPSDMDHVDLNVSFAGQQALGQDITVLIEDGACLDSFSFARLDAADQIFSTHSVNDHVGALIYSWGTEQAELTYTNTNGAKSIEVKYQMLSEYGRNPEDVNLLALCVLTLANINKEVNLYVLKINPANYPVMNISLVNKTGGAWASYTRGYGSAAIPLKDGKCVAGTDV